MEIFKDPKYNWIGNKHWFIGVSLVLALTGSVSLFTRSLSLSVDFTGGSLVFVKFKDTPDLARIRSVLSGNLFRAQGITIFDKPSENQVQIRMGDLSAARTAPSSPEAGAPEAGASGEQAGLRDVSRLLYAALQKEFDPDYAGTDKIDLNQIGSSSLAENLQQLAPDALGAAAEEGQSAQSRAESLADQIVAFRTQNGGLIRDYSELDSLSLPQAADDLLKEKFYLGSFILRSVESVGPKVGSELRQNAQMAVIMSLIGMLGYIWFRFQLVWGMAAIIALFHDVFITLGIFSISGKELSLTVIAALLTLVGYSLNDTIVVFDRVRENMNQMRRRDLAEIANLSINQTLNRTVLTSTTVFLAAMALYLLGGEALDGFSFTLVIGVLVGTYSSIAIASPIVVYWGTRAKKHSR